MSQNGSKSSYKDDIILKQNFPNPFVQRTDISFYLPEKTDIRLSITSLQNEVIKVLFEGKLQKGEHKYSWDSKNLNNEEVTAGKYNYKLEAVPNSFVSIRKMIKKV